MRQVFLPLVCQLAWRLLGKDKDGVSHQTQSGGCSMTDVPSPVTPKRSTVVAQTAKAVVAGLSMPTLIAALPQPEATWVLYACAVFASAGFAATLIPLPANQSGTLWLLYRIINFLALNWKYAANAAVMLRGAASSQAEPPKAGPGSVITIPKDDTK